MTSFDTVSKKCFVCKEKNYYQVLSSTNQFGPSDLDMRPPEMMRSTMSSWIQECPDCGYIANNIDDETTVTLEWLQNNESFKTCGNLKFKSNLSESFYKKYLIDVADGRERDAFYSLVRTAWGCDDCDDEENAIHCRKMAIEQLDKFTTTEREKENLIVAKADLLRRSKQFDAVIDEYSNKTFSQDILNKIIAFQIKLAKMKDSTCYTVADAIEDNT